MARVHRFEDLVAWQKGKDLAVVIYKTTQRGSLSKDFGLSGQMQRSAVSIPSNVAEGYERATPAEFHHGLSTAKGSCGELRTQLYIAAEVGYLSREEFTPLLAQAEEVSRIIGGLREAVRRQKEAKRPRR
ncbi:MAG TPA: four helix bundle protein [Candidatus Methylomirabilis sp.]|jgi:four helix bundle protein